MSKHLQETMTLICMAHLGEAQTFIKQLDLKLIDNEIYRGDGFYLLITGEGPLEVLTILPYILGKYPISKIINLGIAGSLNPKIAIDSIVGIRTVYAYKENSPRFHSYSTYNQNTFIDCITTENRVLDNDYANELSNYAKVIDREAWAIGKVATKFKLAFYCYKLISDYAGAQTQCFDLKARAQEFSETMFKFYQTLSDEKEQIEQNQFSFECSFTHMKKIEKLLLSLNLTVDELNEMFIEIKLAEKNQQTRYLINRLIQKLEKKLNPINHAIDKEFEKLNLPFKDIGAHLHFYPNKDQRQFSLKMDINSQTNIDNLIQELKQLQFENFEKIWDGDFHV